MPVRTWLSLQINRKMKHTLTQIVKWPAMFSHYRDGNLFYNIQVESTLYTFPVDIDNKEDIGNATFDHLYDKSSLPLMRYIRKAIESKTLVFEEI